MGKFLDDSERTKPTGFLLVACLIPISEWEWGAPANNNLESVLIVSPGGGQAGGKKFDLAYHRRLEKYFPDWQERMDYQKTEEKFYQSAIEKRKEIGKVRMKNGYYTKEELDAIDYFKGTRIYAKFQDPRLKPNIFDTRQIPK